MRRPRRTLIVLVLLATVAGACSGSSTTTAPPTTGPGGTQDEAEFVRASMARATGTDITGSELDALVSGDTGLALDLLHATADGGNLILSPYSIASALTMTYAGARGTTAEEMRRVLHVALTDSRLHPARNELDLHLAASTVPVEGDDRTPLTISVANSVWGQQGYPFRDEFLELLATDYGAGIHLADFVAAAETARATINAWVEEATAGRIVDLIPEGMIDELTRLVLVDAIWFKANWAVPFDADLTTPSSFHLLDGGETAADLMHGSLRAGYVAGDGYQAIRLPYAGDAAMLVVLPDEGRFEEIRDSLDAAALAEIRIGLGDHQVSLTMPRFEFRSEKALKPVLQGLGMVSAFTDPGLPGGADFTGMTTRRELMIQDVVHQAFITVDEQGTEAAAATAVVVGLTSAPPAAILTIDRPFLFLIEQPSTGEILFVGQVTDPS